MISNMHKRPLSSNFVLGGKERNAVRSTLPQVLRV